MLSQGLEKTAQKFSALKPFLPPNSFNPLLEYLHKYPLFLKITRERKSILGNYRHPDADHKVHRISVNGNLNPYSFLITFLHEIAHLITYVQFKNKVSPHGSEWQQNYSNLLADFISYGIFPKPIEHALKSSINSPKAATCSDPKLYRALKQYDEREEETILVEQVPAGAQFQTKDGRVFKMVGRVRTRYRCEELNSKKVYSFHALAEVRLVKKE